MSCGVLTVYLTYLQTIFVEWTRQAIREVLFTDAGIASTIGAGTCQREREMQRVAFNLQTIQDAKHSLDLGLAAGAAALESEGYVVLVNHIPDRPREALLASVLAAYSKSGPARPNARAISWSG